MIAFVKGILDDIMEDRVWLDNNGVGFEIYVPGSVIEELPPIGNEVKIYTYLHVREEILQLYGFLTSDELTMFKRLITVNGVGPKGALGILTVMDTDALRFAILSGDSKAIAKAPGIGAKTASKVILELKDKCDVEDFLSSQKETRNLKNPENAVDKQAQKEAVEALVALGYSSTEAAKAVRGVGVRSDLSVEEILKESLKNL